MKNLCVWLDGQRTGLSWHSRLLGDKDVPSRELPIAHQDRGASPQRVGVRAAVPQTSAGWGQAPHDGTGGVLSAGRGESAGGL